MRAVVAILFGASLTIATAWALGAILLRQLSLTLYRMEERLFAFMLGSACLSAILFPLAALRLVHRGVLLVLGILVIGYALYSGAHKARGEKFPALPLLWKIIFIAAFGAFTVVYFVNALAPETSPDGMAYHLGEVAKYYRAHGFVRITTNIYGNLSQGIELLFLHAFMYGKHSATALVHLAYLVCLAFLILAYGRRLGKPAAGVAGAIFFYAASVVGKDGTIAYNDVAVAAIAFSLFYLLQVWDQQRSARLLIAIGILTGFAFAAKYTAFAAIPYVFGFIAWKQWRSRQPLLRPVLLVAALAAIFIAPWLIKNWIWVENPFSPFANRLFPNPYVHISFEQDYRRLEQNYDLKSHWQIPWQVTVKGDVLAGFFGPLFLLAPLALIALRTRVGRQLWLGALVFGLPFYANVGARFLIPPAPFLSLALALTFASAAPVLLLLTVAHAISTWPSIQESYCGSSAWRISEFPYQAALRIESEDAFLSRHSDQYKEARLIDSMVPAGERIFSFGQVADSYTTHEILVGFQAGFNEKLRDILWTPMFNSFQSVRLLTFRFQRRELTAVRVVQTEEVKNLMWNVSEMRAWEGAYELPRAPEWRLTAHPNPWDVQMAFDNSPGTRWRSWQDAEPGMFVQVDFGKARALDAVTITSPDEGTLTKTRLEGRDARGTWETIVKEPVESRVPTPVDLRRAATGELKRRGIHYVLVEKGDYRSDDFERYTSLWGLKCIGESVPNAKLYHIE